MKRPPADNRRILVIRLSSLGDVILTSLLVRRLKARNPDESIDLLTRERYLPLLDGIRPLRRRLGLPEERAGQRALLSTLAEGGYRTVIDLQNNLLSRRIAAASGAEQVLRYHRPRLNRWLRINFPFLRGGLKTPLPVPLGYLETAIPLGVVDDGFGINLYVTSRWRDAARAMLEPYRCEIGHDDDSRPLVIAPGARHAAKVWPPERWAELLGMAYRNGFKAQVIVGEPGDVDVASEILSRAHHPVLSTVGKTGIGELAGLIAAGAVLATSDSAPLHIAAAVGTPVVALFGPTVPEFGFAPFRCRSEVVQVEGLSCRPCHPHGPHRCPKGHFRCMLDISPNMVLAALLRLTQPAEDRVRTEAAV